MHTSCARAREHFSQLSRNTSYASLRQLTSGRRHFTLPRRYLFTVVISRSPQALYTIKIQFRKFDLSGLINSSRVICRASKHPRVSSCRNFMRSLNPIDRTPRHRLAPFRKLCKFGEFSRENFYFSSLRARQITFYRLYSNFLTALCKKAGDLLPRRSDF